MPTVDENFIKRIQPHSEEAEKSVLGSMLMDRDAIVEAEDILVKEDFYQRQYGILFEAMVELYQEGKPVDLITLQDKLKEKDVPEALSSLDFFRELVDIVPTSTNVRQYAPVPHQGDRGYRQCLLSGQRGDAGYSGENGERDFRSAAEPEQNVRFCTYPGYRAEFLKCHRRCGEDQRTGHRYSYRVHRARL